MKENISLSIAILALIFSGVTLYYQFFYKSIAIEAMLVGGRTEYLSDSLKTLQHKVDIIFKNTGTSSTGIYSICFEPEGDQLYCDEERFPIILESGEMEYYRFSPKGLRFGNLSEISSRPEKRKIHLYVDYINAEGRKQENLEIGWFETVKRDSIISFKTLSTPYKIFTLN